MASWLAAAHGAYSMTVTLQLKRYNSLQQMNHSTNPDGHTGHAIHFYHTWMMFHTAYQQVCTQTSKASTFVEQMRLRDIYVEVSMYMHQSMDPKVKLKVKYEY
jgi:hypothetical protein